MDPEDDPAKLKADNRRLQKELRTLVVEKNLMEDKLYRAFHKLLQTKKRKVRELEWELKKLKGEEDSAVAGTGSDPSSHCETCRCAGSPSRKKTRKVRVEKANHAEDNSDSDTQDPFAGGYSDDTDLDDEPASKSSSKTNSPSKTVVVRCHEPSGTSTISGASSSKAGAKSKPLAAEGTSIPVSEDSSTLDKTKPKEVSGNSEKSSSEDFEQLVDAFCA